MMCPARLLELRCVLPDGHPGNHEYDDLGDDMTESEFLGRDVKDLPPAKSMTIAELIRESHATAVEKGWWEKDRPFSEGIALMHSELSEALEEWRKHGMGADWILYIVQGKPEGIAAEFADVMIRIADWCGRYDVPLEKALRDKMQYNRSREHRHGGKLA